MQYIFDRRGQIRSYVPSAQRLDGIGWNDSAKLDHFDHDDDDADDDHCFKNKSMCKNTLL